MFIQNKANVSKRERNGLTSYFLLGAQDIPETPLASTWVTVEPGGRQIPHHHPEIQIYVIVQGGGLMRVGDETAEVSTGDLIYIPSDQIHGIENNSDQPLHYISAATPAFDLPDAYDRGQLSTDAY
jgi:mannose-6-phosphate isomerase-like protein (cupin superfamily)